MAAMLDPSLDRDEMSSWLTRRTYRDRALLSALIVLIIAASTVFAMRYTVRPGAEAPPAKEGYTAVGSIDGIRFWVKLEGSDIAVRSTGKYGGVCNRLGPAAMGSEVCAGNITGKYAVLAYLTDSTTRGVAVSVSKAGVETSVDLAGVLDLGALIPGEHLLVAIVPGGYDTISGQPTFRN